MSLKLDIPAFKDNIRINIYIGQFIKLDNGVVGSLKINKNVKDDVIKMLSKLGTQDTQSNVSIYTFKNIELISRTSDGDRKVIQKKPIYCETLENVIVEVEEILNVELDRFPIIKEYDSHTKIKQTNFKLKNNIITLNDNVNESYFYLTISLNRTSLKN